MSWLNPIDGTWIDQKKKFNGDRFRGKPPDEAHDWVLYVRKEGKKENWNKSFFLESRREAQEHGDEGRSPTRSSCPTAKS